MAGVEGLQRTTKYNGLAESGAVLDPHIICKNLDDCPTAHADRHLVRDDGSSNPATPTTFPRCGSGEGNDLGMKRLVLENMRPITSNSSVVVAGHEPKKYLSSAHS
jgi:hypothetical protein